MAEDTITVGANSEYPVNVTGKFFAVLSCTNSFQIEVDGGGKRTCSAGVKFSFESFRRIVFFETAGQANTITFYAGEAQYDGTIPREGDAVPVVAAGGLPLQVTDADTFDYPYLMATDGSLLPVSHTTPTPLPAEIVISGKTYRRKSFHIANHINGSDLGVYKDTGECVDIVQANTDRSLSFSFDVNIQFRGSDNGEIALYYTLYSTPV